MHSSTIIRRVAVRPATLSVSIVRRGFHYDTEKKLIRHQRFSVILLTLGFTSLAFTSFSNWNYNKRVLADANAHSHNTKQTDTTDPHPIWQAGSKQTQLPYFSRKQVSQHSTLDDLWLTYREGVYDLTTYVDEHPGAPERLLLATNGNCDLCDWWKQLGYHNVKDVHQLVEKYRIANLNANDVIECDTLPVIVDKELEESRKPLHDTCFSFEPFIAETPIEQLAHYYTPVEYHFVRSHCAVPTYLSLDDELTISGIGVVPATQSQQSDAYEYCITYQELLSLPSVTRDVYLQCGGHRRREYLKYGTPKGSKWDVGAIGNGKYRGVLLRDLLISIGVDVDSLYNQKKPLFVHLIGADIGPGGESYGVSIPAHKALDPRGDVLLAYQHNGEPLTWDHGYPLRAVVPGYVASRSIKWLESIVISDCESELKSFSNSYRMTYDMEQEIRELPVNSAIHSPLDGAVLPANETRLVVAGEAHSGGGRGIIRVDVSIDNGETWFAAKLLNGNENKHVRDGRQWSWCKWECSIDLNHKFEHMYDFDIMCRAYDTAHNRQPETCQHDLVFNPKGYAANCYHRIHVTKLK